MLFSLFHIDHCLFIVFASLLEYAAVGYLLKRVKMKREEREKTYAALPMLFAGAAATGSSNPPLPFGCLSAGSAVSPGNRQPIYQGTSFSVSVQSLTRLLLRAVRKFYQNVYVSAKHT